MEIRLEGVGKTYAPGCAALTDVNLTVESGRWLVLVGPSGCGKTTLLRLIAGLETPTTGTVTLDGIDARRLPPWRRDVALLFQRPALLPGQSVRHNLSWGWTLRQGIGGLFGLRGLPPRQEHELIEMARLLDLDGLLDRPAGQLSGGQQQRVALGRILLRHARACLLDEPLGHLDAPRRAQMSREIRLLSRRFPATMLYVTHDPAEARALGETIAILHRGCLQQVADPYTIDRQPANRFVAELFAQDFGGLNLLPGRLCETPQGRRFRGCWGDWPIPPAWQELAPDGAEVILGLRGKDVRVATEAADESAVLVMMTVLLKEYGPTGRRVVCTDDRSRLTAELAASQTVNEGQSVMLELHLSRAFCFAGAAGTTLFAPTG